METMYIFHKPQERGIITILPLSHTIPSAPPHISNITSRCPNLNRREIRARDIFALGQVLSAQSLIGYINGSSAVGVSVLRRIDVVTSC
jgi:hypothetical protein